MKYFGLNIPFTTNTVDDQCIEHYGCMIFELSLLWMINSDQRSHYMVLYYDNTYNSIEEFHANLFPLIKSDWESGKIKLKKSTKN